MLMRLVTQQQQQQQQQGHTIGVKTRVAHRSISRYTSPSTTYSGNTTRAAAEKTQHPQKL
jgi:hypothetical protein